MQLSLITNEKGKPLNVNLFKGNLNDINIFNKQLVGLYFKLFDKKTTIFMAVAGLPRK